MKIPSLVFWAFCLLISDLWPQQLLFEWWSGDKLGGDFDEFGTSCCAGKDYDADGVGDFAMGAEYRGPGEVWVKSGKTGSTLLHLRGRAIPDRFGSGVRFVDDLSGDGVPDLIIAAESYSELEQEAGRVYVYAGGSGALLYTPLLHKRDRRSS